jgi:hypothetical protein
MRSATRVSSCSADGRRRGRVADRVRQPCEPAAVARSAPPQRTHVRVALGATRGRLVRWSSRLRWSPRGARSVGARAGGTAVMAQLTPPGRRAKPGSVLDLRLLGSRWRCRWRPRALQHVLGCRRRVRRGCAAERARRVVGAGRPNPRAFAVVLRGSGAGAAGGRRLTPRTPPTRDDRRRLPTDHMMTIRRRCHRRAIAIRRSARYPTNASPRTRVRSWRQAGATSRRCPSPQGT